MLMLGFTTVKSFGEFGISNDPLARAFGAFVPNPPPLGHLMKPPHQGFADKTKKKKNKTTPRPTKEESEEINEEEHEEEEEEEEENGSNAQENTNDGIAVSTPPDGASIAEAKPIGLAIAGPGGVAASKPQGTAVVGPGGLAIARPVGTAIAGVDVEGSVPIGGAQKNKKKPKQEEQTEADLHYVGGLTGPIGHPKPKEFSDTSFKSLRDGQEENLENRLFFQGRQGNNGFQLKLGQIGGKYGFIPMYASPQESGRNYQKTPDASAYLHGPLGNDEEDNEAYHAHF